MKFDCSYCDKIIDDSDKEEYNFHISRGHELFQIISEHDETSTEEQKNTSKKLYQFAKTKIKKCIVLENDSSQVFALIENNGHIETLDISNSKAKSWLRFSYYSQTGNNYSEDTYASALLLVKAEAIHGGAPRESIYNRIAMLNDEIWYDLAAPDWTALKITKESINVVPLNQASPIFVRTQSQKRQLTPVFEDKNSLDELVELLRIPLGERHLFQVHLTSMFLEGFPIPIMSIVGEHGSIKSTISKSIKQIVDPSGSKTISLLGNTENLSLSFQNRYCICFDNVSKIDQATSDFLCKAVTGDGNTKRKLYTDSDEIIYDYKRKIILNGISPNLEFPDLVDRNIRYVTEKISEDERITEEEFEKKFQHLLPFVLGQIFQTLSSAMKMYDSVKTEVKYLPRMADFAIWGECISRVLGYKPFSFIDNYVEKINSHSIDVIDTYPIISITEQLLENSDHYEKTVQEFFNDIKIRAEAFGIDIHSRYVNFPRAANKVREHIARLKPNFRSIGIEIYIAPYTKRDNKHPKNRHVIYLDRIKNTLLQYDDESLLSIPSLPDKHYVQTEENIGRHSGKEQHPKFIPSLPYIAKFMPRESTGIDGNYGNETSSDLEKI